MRVLNCAAKEVPGVPCTTLFLCRRPEVGPRGTSYPDSILNKREGGLLLTAHPIQVGINDATPTTTLPILARRLARIFLGGGVSGFLSFCSHPRRSLAGGKPAPRGEGWRSSTATKMSWEEQNWTCGRPQATPNLVLGWVSGRVWSPFLSPAGSTGRPGVSGQERPSKAQANAASRGRP